MCFPESANEDLESVEPGNYLKFSRAKYTERGLETPSQPELQPNTPENSSRSAFHCEEEISDPLISFDDEESEPEDELEGYPSFSPPIVSPSMTSVELDVLDRYFPREHRVAGGHENSARGTPMEEAYQQMDRSNVVSPEPSFHVSPEEYGEEQFCFSRSSANLSSEAISTQSACFVNEKIPGELRNNSAIKLEKMVEENLRSLSMRSANKTSKLPPKPMKGQSSRRPPSLERTLAFSYGAHDKDEDF